MKRRLDLIQSVLGLLYQAFPGEQITDTDIALVDSYIDGKFEELGRRKIYYVQDADAIDEAVFLPLAKIIANAVAPQYKLPFYPEVDVLEERRLRDVDRRPAHYVTLVTDYI